MQQMYQSTPFANATQSLVNALTYKDKNTMSTTEQKTLLQQQLEELVKVGVGGKFKNKRIKIILILLILLVSSIFIIFRIDTVANLPKYKVKIWNDFFKIFMKLPDPIKSSFMIISGRRSFSNLFNDYNVKFLPETQYISINFKRKKIKFDKENQYRFYLEIFKDKLIIVTKKGVFYQSNLSALINNEKEINYKNSSIISTLLLGSYCLYLASASSLLIFLLSSCRSFLRRLRRYPSHCPGSSAYGVLSLSVTKTS